LPHWTPTYPQAIQPYPNLCMNSEFSVTTKCFRTQLQLRLFVVSLRGSSVIFANSCNSYFGIVLQFITSYLTLNVQWRRYHVSDKGTTLSYHAWDYSLIRNTTFYWISTVVTQRIKSDAWHNWLHSATCFGRHPAITRPTRNNVVKVHSLVFPMGSHCLH